MVPTSHDLRRAPVSRALIALLLGAWLALGAPAAASAAVVFRPDSVISDNAMRDYDSMSVAQIQAFLNKRPGRLDTLVTTDCAGVRKPASRIIWEACQRWTISPKVMLTMLQKEQSLLTRRKLAKNTLSRAIGAGCPDGKTNRYPGFGKQMWWGAYCLDGYGEGRNRPGLPIFRQGVAYWVYGKRGAHLHPKNLGTFKLYVYNPSIGAKKPYGGLSRRACTGNANFWKIYRKYFGDPRNKPVLHSVVHQAQVVHGSILPLERQVVRYGSNSATFTIQPALGYHIADVLVDGLSVGPVTDYRFIGVWGPRSIRAAFAIDTYSIVPGAGDNGFISPDTTQTVNYGGSTTFAITPDLGYAIADVLVDGASIGSSSTVSFTNVTSDHTIWASFAPLPELPSP
jgi:hypothetical protein